MDRFIWYIILISSYCNVASSIVAYDCGHEKINKTRISLLTIEECDIKLQNITHEQQDIQLLELNEVASIHIHQCKISISQSVYYCGMFSHLSLVPGGLSTFIVDISRDDCLKIHNNGTYRLENNKIISEVRTNSSTRGTEIVSGVIDQGNNCKGTSYSYGTHIWNDVIVIHTFEITISDYYSSVRLEDNQVILRSNILCPYLQRQCMDVEYGMSFWELIPDSSCESLSYTVLYQGNASRAENLDVNINKKHVIYSVNTGDLIFALEIAKPISVCSHSGYQTEHPRLVIIGKSEDGYWFNKTPENPKNLNLLTYVNTKFVYVERHIKAQIETLYVNLIRKRCELERDLLRTQVAIAIHHPSEFALMRMQELGYTAIARGEVIYIIKCQAVDITLRKTDRCFNELPVQYNNESYFMAPSTHLLQKYGTEIPCSETLIPAYFIHDSWYGFSPQAHRLESPMQLKPSREVDWKYKESHDLIKAGIYSSESAENLRKQIMYPTERRAIENVLTRALTGHDTDTQNLQMFNLFSKDTFEHFSSYFGRTWWFLTGFGSICSFIMGIGILIRIIKCIFNTIINLHMIKTIHGKSWWLLAAVCSSLTNFILLKERQQTSNSKHSFKVVDEEANEYRLEQVNQPENSHEESLKP